MKKPTETEFYQNLVQLRQLEADQADLFGKICAGLSDEKLKANFTALRHDELRHAAALDDLLDNTYGWGQVC